MENEQTTSSVKSSDVDNNITESQITFRVPEKRINTPADFEKWKTSKALKTYQKFIQLLNDAVKGKPLSVECHVSELVTKIVGVIEKMEKLLDEYPPTAQSSRYGNKAFRDYFARIEKEAEGMVQDVLPENLKGAAIELAPYLVGSIGNSTRIDYGSGHEASFATFLCCFHLLGLLTEKDHVAIVTKIFNRYLKYIRKVQRQYMLEPAGSHGVWGLDDYQFLPFVFGSSQFIDHPTVKPKSIHDKALVEELAEDYMYMACIKFINECKKGPFGEHSPKLNDISYVPHQLWTKVNFGMQKMYEIEVLNKFPVIQHFLFGNIIPFE